VSINLRTEVNHLAGAFALARDYSCEQAQEIVTHMQEAFERDLQHYGFDSNVIRELTKDAANLSKEIV
jgi:hypothetical protein